MEKGREKGLKKKRRRETEGAYRGKGVKGERLREKRERKKRE